MSGSSFCRSAILFGVALLSSGCYSRITGEEGAFTIGYASMIETENFVKPIAPGAKLDLVAFANGTEDELSIIWATSSRPGVLAIDSVNGARVVVKAGAVGSAVIEIRAKDKTGKSVVDRMFFHVRKPSTHKIEHACTEGKDAAYVRGEPIDIFHALSTDDKRPVIGYGWVPVKTEPAGALDLVAQPPANAMYRFQAKKAGTGIKLTSTVDASELTFRIVERSELTEAVLHAPERMVVGTERYAVVDVKLGETPLCSQTALTKARSLTPDICEVTGRLDDDASDTNRWQLANIVGKAFGTCRYEITLSELAGGKGVTLKGETQVGRVEYPKEKSFLRDDLAMWAGLSKWYVISRLGVLGGLLLWRRRRRSVD